MGATAVSLAIGASRALSPAVGFERSHWHTVDPRTILLLRAEFYFGGEDDRQVDRECCHSDCGSGVSSCVGTVEIDQQLGGRVHNERGLGGQRPGHVRALAAALMSHGGQNGTGAASEPSPEPRPDTIRQTSTASSS